MKIAGFLTLGMMLLMAVLLAIVLWKWPFTRGKTEGYLASATGAAVKLDAYQKSYFPPGFIATRIRFGRTDRPDEPVIAEIKRLEVRDRWINLLTFRRSVPQILVYDTHLLIPPRSEIHNVPKSPSKQELGIGEIVFNRVTVDFASKHPGDEAVRLPIRQLRLTRIGPGKPFQFDAFLENPMPHGEIHEQGTFGPWVSEEPSRTPIAGTYTFRNGDLADLRGVSGLIQAQGKFQGELEKIDVEGSAVVPDFRVIHASHSAKLDSTYRASVNATTGDVELNAVHVDLGHTRVEAAGRVAGEAGHKGKVATLKAIVTQGRVEDLEYLFISSKTAPLFGAVSLETSIRLPSGPAHFLTRLEMGGHFETTGETFHNPSTQGMLNRLHESAAGESKDAQNTDGRVTRSSMRANVVVKSGTATITHLILTAPDTTVRMEGTFKLISKDMNLNGTLQTDGKLSDTQTGFKSFAIKMITPFLKKAHHTTLVPFTITGKYGDLHPRLDLDQKQKL